MTTSEDLPRLIFTPWGYLTKGQAMLNYQNGLEHPATSRLFDTTTHTYTVVDWTVPGTIEEHLGIEKQ